MPQSKQCQRPETQFFEPKLKDATYEQTQTLIVHPINSVINQKIIEFILPAQENHYYNLFDTTLTAEFETLDKKTDAKWAKQEGVVPGPTPINNLLYSRFAELHIYMNEKIIFSERHYPYYAYLTQILNRPPLYQEFEGRAAGFIKDQSYMDSTSATDNPNPGAVARQTMIGAEGEFQLNGPIIAPLFAQGNLIPPGTTIRLKFVLGSDEFCVIDNRATDADRKGYSFKLTSAKICAQLHKLNKTLSTNILSTWNKTNIEFPLRQSEIKTYLIPSQSSTYRIAQLSNGLLPTQIFIAFADQTSFNGNLKKNPFNFKTFNFLNANLQINGQDLLDNLPQALNFNKDQFAQLYNHFRNHLGYFNSNFQGLIKYEDYKAGYFLIGFNLTKSLSPNFEHCLENDNFGSIDAVINFNSGNPDPIMAICFLNYNGVITVAKDTTVSTNFIP